MMSKVTRYKPEFGKHFTKEHDAKVKADLKKWLNPKNWDYNKHPLHKKYKVKTNTIENESGTSDSLRCEVMALHEYWWEQGVEPYAKLGFYERNFWSFYNTFHPFHKDGKDYALYSPDYTTTRVMKLPECEDITGEKADHLGFCPVDFFVPCPQQGKTEYNGTDGSFGFVAGCVWGDDSSMKVQFLDLSKIEDGEFVRDDRFGYHELPDKISLEDSIDLSLYHQAREDYDHIKIASIRSFTMKENMDVFSYFDGVHPIGEDPSWNEKVL